MPPQTSPAMKTSHGATNELYTTDDVIELEEICFDSVILSEGLPTGGWDQIQEKDGEL